MNNRCDDVLTFIRTNSELCAHKSSVQQSALGRHQDKAINKNYARMIEDHILKAGISRADLDSALSLGESRQNNAVRKEQRLIIRAVLLAELTIRGTPLSQAKSLKEKYLAYKDTGALQRLFRSKFPSILSVQGRSAWLTSNFTDPRSLPPFVGSANLKTDIFFSHDGRDADYTFIITSLPADDAAVPTLGNFDTSIYQWMAISTSVIAQGNSIIYGFHGFILECDPLAIMSASGADQSIENHTGTARNTRAAAATGDQLTDNGRLTEELHRKFYETNNDFDANPFKLMSPQQVLSHTDLAKAKSSKAPDGWNEVVIAGPKTRVIGLFVKVDKSGKPIMRRAGGTMLRQSVIDAINACSKKTGLPVVALQDSRE